MKPFLLLGIRAEDVAADEEYAAMMRCTGLGEGELQRIRMEQRPLGSLDLDKWSGIILGGGPFQVSDPDEKKSATQLRVEAELADLLDDVVEHDHPFLGSCYGIGTLGSHEGAVVDRTYGEPIGGIQHHADLGRQPGSAVQRGEIHLRGVRRPQGGDHQAAGTRGDAGLRPSCPVQAFRVGTKIYATQFHPELDLEGLKTRVEIYKYAGYFEPDQADAVIAAAQASGITETPNFLGRFVTLFASD